MLENIRDWIDIAADLTTIAMGVATVVVALISLIKKNRS